MAQYAAERSESAVATANPAPLGLSAFALTTFVLSSVNVGFITAPGLFLWWPWTDYCRYTGVPERQHSCRDRLLLLRWFLACLWHHLHTRPRHSSSVYPRGRPSYSSWVLPPGLGNLHWHDVPGLIEDQSCSHGSVLIVVPDLPRTGHRRIWWRKRMGTNWWVAWHSYRDSCLVHSAGRCSCLWQEHVYAPNIPKKLALELDPTRATTRDRPYYATKSLPWLVRPW